MVDFPIGWLPWFQGAFCFKVMRAVRIVESWGVPPKPLWNSLLTAAAREDRTHEEAVRSAARQFQHKLYSLLVQKTPAFPCPADRIRQKFERWKFGHLYPAELSRLMAARIPSLRGKVTPRVLSALFKTWWNGWTTSKRFQKNEACLFGCCSRCDTDAIEHYSLCPQTNALRQVLHLPVSFNSLAGFLLTIRHMSDVELVLGALTVYAVYSAVNTLRHTARMRSEHIPDMLIEFCKLGTMGHSHSLKILQTALGGGLDVVPRGARRAAPDPPEAPREWSRRVRPKSPPRRRV
jgi:hypothetical protein